MIVRVALDGFATPLPPAAVADTVTDLFAAMALLSTAVTVTNPVLVVAPAAIVSVVAVLSVKSPDTAGDTAAAATVSVVAAVVRCESVAVTVETPPSSEIESGVSTSDAVGVGSLSVVVTDTSVFARPL